jgi:cytochrome c oxidase assembly protein subunit 15
MELNKIYFHTVTIHQAFKKTGLSLPSNSTIVLQPADPSRKKRIVAYWLLLGVFMIIIQIILGGITRLTGSGLSITEWKPIMGAIPPLNHHDWMEAFDKYKQIAQFKYRNADFTLNDFQFIFFWEWFHRLWARTLGVVFAIPFIYFLVKKYFERDMVLPLVLLFILGGLQGLIGWIMVQSGLTSHGLLHVCAVRLTIHFMSALVLLIYTFWFALKLLVPAKSILHRSRLHLLSLSIIILFGIQLIYGGLMAGLKAANTAPTWPKINGDWVPASLSHSSWFHQPINVQFIHRGIAYILFFAITWFCFKIQKTAQAAGYTLLFRVSKWPLILVMLQVLLGILTVLNSPKITLGHFGVFETLAALHQLNAIALLLALFFQFYLLRKNKTA